MIKKKLICQKILGEKAEKQLIDQDPQNVVFNFSKDELEKKIRSFIEQKQRQNNETNKSEFLMENNEGCARTDTNQISKQTHVIKSRMFNESGPLDKSNQENISKNRNKKNKVIIIDDDNGIDERMKNIEAYLQIPTSKKIPSDVYERLKQLENTIMDWEKNHEMLQQYQLSFPPKEIKKQNKRKMPEKPIQSTSRKISKKSTEKISPLQKPKTVNSPKITTRNIQRKRNSLQFKDDFF